MEYLKIDREFPRLSKSAVTLGKFDGIHRGHQKLVERILEQKEKGLQTVLFSLGIGSQMIFTKEERCRILEKAGVDVLVECPLDTHIRHMKAETFIKGRACCCWRRFPVRIRAERNAGAPENNGNEARIYCGYCAEGNGRTQKDQQYLYPRRTEKRKYGKGQ